MSSLTDWGLPSYKVSQAEVCHHVKSHRSQSTFISSLTGWGLPSCQVSQDTVYIHAKSWHETWLESINQFDHRFAKSSQSSGGRLVIQVDQSFSKSSWSYFGRLIDIYTQCLRKKEHFCFLLELYQISTNFNKFWQEDGKMTEIVCYIYIFHLN